MFTNQKFDKGNLAKYGSIVIVLLGLSFILFKIKKDPDLENRSNMFSRILSNEKQYKNDLLKNNDIYSEMTKLYFCLENDPEFSQYFHTYFHRLMCIFPSFFLSQIAVYFLLKSDRFLEDVDFGYINRSSTPWTEMIDLIKLTVNNQDTGYLSNACFPKAANEINELIEKEFRCAHLEPTKALEIA
jgi:hypothetical protein